MSHARRFDLEAVKLSAKRSNVYGLSNYFWQRKLRFRNRDYHRAAKLYLKSLFDRTLNRLELKLIPKLGQDYPNLFERWRNLNLGLSGFRIFSRSLEVKSRVKYGDEIKFRNDIKNDSYQIGFLQIHELRAILV